MQVLFRSFRSSGIPGRLIGVLLLGLAVGFPFGSVEAQEGFFFDGQSFERSDGLIDVFQDAESNVVGIVQLGPSLDLASVVQRGNYNRVAIIQAADEKLTFVNQFGTSGQNYNRSLVIQISDEVTDSAGICQFQGVPAVFCSPIGPTVGDPINYAVQIQTVVGGSDPVTTALSGLGASDMQGVVMSFLFAPESVRAQPEAVNDSNRDFLDRLAWRRFAYTQSSCERADGTVDTANCGRLTVFASAGYMSGGREARLGSLDYDYSGQLGMFGVEFKPNQKLRLGAALQYSELDLDTGYDIAEADIDGTHLGIYGNYSNKGLFVGAAASVASQGVDLKRVYGAGLTAEADPDANAYGMRLHGGYLSRFGDFTLGPVASIEYSQAKVDAYNESGNVLITQAVSSQRDKRLTIDLGAQAGYRTVLRGITLEAFASVLAEQERDLGDDDEIETAFSLSGDSVVFTPLDNDYDGVYTRLAGGVVASVAKDVRFSVAASGVLGGSQRDAFSLGANLSIDF